MANLIEGLLSEMNRVRELIKEYESLPDNAGFFGSTMMKDVIKRAEKNIASGDVIEELKSFEELKGCTG